MEDGFLIIECERKEEEDDTDQRVISLFLNFGCLRMPISELDYEISRENIENLRRY